MKTTILLFFLFFYSSVAYAGDSSAAYAGDCATGITENTSHIIFDSTLVATSGLLTGDRILVLWEDDIGNIYCAGQSNPYIPGFTFAIHPISGERLGGAIAITVWMDEPLHNDPLDWPFGTSIYLVVERSAIWYLTLAAASEEGPLCAMVDEQPWPHTGGEQFFCMSDFIVLVATIVENDGDGILIVTPYPNPSNGVIHFSYTTFRIQDLRGRVVREGLGNRIDLSALPAGRYVFWTEIGSCLITLN